MFAYSYRPGWAYVVAILLFPFGLIAARRAQRGADHADFDPLPRGRARIVAHGRAPRRVRQAFAERR